MHAFCKHGVIITNVCVECNEARRIDNQYRDRRQQELNNGIDKPVFLLGGPLHGQCVVLRYDQHTFTIVKQPDPVMTSNYQFMDMTTALIVKGKYQYSCVVRDVPGIPVCYAWQGWDS